MQSPNSSALCPRPWFAPFVFVLVLSGCIQSRWGKSPQSQSEARSSQTQRSEQGNPPFYEVFGRRYYVMDASSGYTERGVASWYGKKFHGGRTSNGEIYNMHAMTAAHKTLPLPTQVRVTNLRNGRSVIVRVNDRGPFVDNRIIDLSYSAALRLGIVRAGTAMVEVSALPAHDPVDTASTWPTPKPIDPVPRQGAEASVYLQVGAFGDRFNAQQLQARLQAGGFTNTVIHHDPGESPILYRVRLGPIGDVAEYDRLLQRVAALHIRDTHLVTENGATDIVTHEPSGI